LAYRALFVEKITEIPGEEEVIFPSGSQCIIEKVKFNKKNE